MTDAGDYLKAKEDLEAHLRQNDIMREFDEVLLEHIKKKLSKLELPKKEITKGVR